MRKSRISQDTSKILSAVPLSPRRSTRSSLARFVHNANESNVKGEANKSSDIEDAITPPEPSRKRKHEESKIPQKRASQRPQVKVEVKTEIEDSVEFPLSPIKERKARKPARKIKNEETGEVEIHPPENWRLVYDTVMAMRKTGNARNAAVDTMGCEYVLPGLEPLCMISCDYESWVRKFKGHDSRSYNFIANVCSQHNFIEYTMELRKMSHLGKRDIIL